MRLDLITFPECGAPIEVIKRFVLSSTDGPVVAQELPRVFRFSLPRPEGEVYWDVECRVNLWGEMECEVVSDEVE